MRKLVLVLVLLVAMWVVTAASAHNAAHFFLPSGKCINVGSDKSAPLVPEQNPNRNATTGELDLVPGPATSTAPGMRRIRARSFCRGIVRRRALRKHRLRRCSRLTRPKRRHQIGLALRGGCFLAS